MREVMLAASTPRSRLFRNNTGALQDRNGAYVRFGLAVGSSDLIGLTTVTITDAHVGRDIAVFTAIEVKDGTPLTPEQLAFISVVRSMGGIAGVAESVPDYHAITHDWQRSK